MEFDAQLLNDVMLALDTMSDQAWRLVGEVSYVRGTFSCVAEIEEGPMLRFTHHNKEWEVIIVDLPHSVSGLLHDDYTKAMSQN